MKKAISILLAVALLAALAIAGTGCGRDVDLEPDLTQILADLDILTVDHRPIGSQESGTPRHICSSALKKWAMT